MRLVAAVAIATLSAGSALAFGTINAAGQSAEHEKITRRALACRGGETAPCFGPRSLDQLAGTRGRFGAVGYPDSSAAIFKPRAHCDNGDRPGGLEACRDWMTSHLDKAVRDAARLLDERGNIWPSQVRLTPGCVWALNAGGRAKCDVLQSFGVVLHASQDFYSHSNWTDDARETGPRGLGHAGPAPAIGLRAFPAFPKDLVSGCFAVRGCSGRVTHAALNKDTGQIGETVGPGTTPRGRRHRNFERAVAAAQADTADKWALLRERLVETYGRERGRAMACALTRDDPVKHC